MAHFAADDLCVALEPLLHPRRRGRRAGGRKVPDRVALEGTLFVVRTGIQSKGLTGELGTSGKTWWCRLRQHAACRGQAGRQVRSSAISL